MDKATKTLIDNNMCDGSILLFCTTWNASIGGQYITVFDDNLFITPISGGVYGANIKKSIKINKSDIEDIVAVKSFWTGSKVIIKLKGGKEYKYKLVNSSWIEVVNELKDTWFISDKRPFKVVKKEMTVKEAFLLDCRVTAKHLNANEQDFTISELVYKVVNNDNDAEEWLNMCAETIYNLLKEDIKSGNLNAKIVLTKKGDEIIYRKIKFLVKK